MENAPVTAATGALGPVIAKLAALLGSEYKLRWRTRRDVSFIRSKLEPMHSILWNIWEREELDEASKALKMEALDLADELDDAIFDFILSMERSRNNKRLVQTKIKASPFQDFKKQASDVSGRCRSKWKKPFSSVLSCGKIATDDSRPVKPRAYPFVRKDVSELVGMAGPRDKLIQNLVGEDETTPTELQLKEAFIYGTAGMGKTTLADLVYQAIGDKFESRAFVSVTRPGGNMREVLGRILEQVAANSSIPLAGNKPSTEEHLIDIISTFLKDKRYLVIIDDIWNWKEWEVIKKSLPENNLGSRIVGTTRITDVAKEWGYYDHDDPMVPPKEEKSLLHKMLPKWDRRNGWVYRTGENNIVTGILALKADIAVEGFDYEHPIVHMCGGMPMAVLCMLSAVAKEREKQGQHAKACGVQDEVEKHVMENGIQNTPGFEPLVESLQLGYDGLPHHMIKTCLLYCSIYPDGQNFEDDDLVRRWISEGFVYTEEEANSYLEELVNRGLINGGSRLKGLKMDPMLRNFLKRKSHQDNFITCSSDITPSYNNTCRVRRLYICNSTCKSSDAATDPLSALDWSHIRSLIVCEGIERIPFDKLEGVLVLDLCWIKSLLDHHLKDICGLVRLRHLLGLNGDGIREIPPEIVRLQCLETLQASGRGVGPLPGFIGNLQQLKTLKLRSSRITEMPREIGSLQQLKHLEVTCSSLKELPREIGALQQLHTLRIRGADVAELPREVWSLEQLKTLDICGTEITVLPKEIGKLQQLRTLDVSGTQITVLPKVIGKLQHLEQLLMIKTTVAKIPREIGALKKLKSLKLDYSTAALPLEVCALLELPECIHQALNKSGLVSELAGEMISFRKSTLAQEYNMSDNGGGLVIGRKQMHIPSWIKEHFNDISLLDIRICKLEEQGLKILREMPKLEELILKFDVVPKEPVAIIGQGFAMLEFLTINSRVPRVTFKEGAMPKLGCLTFRFQFYAGPLNEDPVGINHLRSLFWIRFECNEDGYRVGDSPCIRPMIDVVRKEARELPSEVHLHVCGPEEDIYSPPPSPPPPTEMGQQRDMEEEERSSGVGEIEEDIQA